MTIIPFDRSDFILGGAGIPGTGITSAQVADFESRLDALEAVTPATSVDSLSDAVITTPATGQLLRYDGTNWVNWTDVGHTTVGAMAFIIDGGGAVVASGVKGDLPPATFAGTITGVGAYADQSGSITIQCWKDTIANYPPTVADLLFTLTLSSAIRTPTGSDPYTTVSYAFSVGDVLRFNVTSTATSITRATVGLRFERTIL